MVQCPASTQSTDPGFVVEIEIDLPIIKFFGNFQKFITVFGRRIKFERLLLFLGRIPEHRIVVMGQKIVPFRKGKEHI